MLKKGCGCRGSSGMAHLDCAVAAAPHQKNEAGQVEGFLKCPTCKHKYSGAMKMGLARADVELLAGLDPDHPDRLTAMANLAAALGTNGEHAEAEAIIREVLAAETRLFGAEHPSTLRRAANLVNALGGQGRWAEAVTMGAER